jgi:putative Ca2+/H+ antiporter (TMEM165/GDT1 family)
MDWKLFATAFVSVFVAEIGDKTQLATMAFSAESRRPWLVFAAASLALVAAAGVGAALGGLLSRWIPETWMRRGAAALFVAIGVWMFVSADKH